MTTTRREFLKTGVAGSTMACLGPSAPAFLARAALAGSRQTDDRDTILVVLQLAGGNDGLNTVVPYDDDQYARNRTTLRLTKKQVLSIDDSLLGFHPRMPEFLKLYHDGLLSIVQGVGYPNPNGDHARSMRNWQSAQPEHPNGQTGWLGRAIDLDREGRPTSAPAALVGNIRQPLALAAERSIVPAYRSIHDAMSRPVLEDTEFWTRRERLMKMAQPQSSAPDNPLLDFVQRSSLLAISDSQRIETVAHRQSRGIDYPAIELADRLRTIAQLIRAELGIRIFYTELGGEEPGGFDNHANQFGNHDALLHQLSRSLIAFVDDLGRDGLLDRVVVMTFSEFGRTLAENGRRGTDHGSAAPMFLVGGCVRPGLIGTQPNLDELENGGPKHTVDFRRVYAAVLDNWLGIDSRTVLGETFAPLNVLRS